MTTPDRTARPSRPGAARQQWGGIKGPVKRLLALGPVHVAVRSALPVLRPDTRLERLPAPRSVRAVVARMSGVEFTMLAPDRCVVAKELWWGAGRRPRPADQLALDVFAAFARDADTVLDVGAYTGLFSLLAARVNPHAEVHAVELVPAVYKAAFDNLAANGLLGRVRLHCAAAGEQIGELTVADGAGGSALPDFWSVDRAAGPPGAAGPVVPVRPLDVLVPNITVGEILVKIDVEGTEDEVLAGATGLLRRHRPHLLCEVLPGARWDRLHESLSPYGYRYYLVTDHELVEHDLPRPQAHRDWLVTTLEPQAVSARTGVPVLARHSVQ